jgi:hypothetical protein
LTPAPGPVTLTAMKRALQILFAATWLLPGIALACPYASAGSECGACGSSSSLGYGLSLLLGVGAGFASVALERRRSS